MAKGKKKGNKKESDDSKEAGGDAPSISGLSIVDDAPSTSQAPDDDDGGLGLGMSAAARRKLKKQKQVEAKAACQEATISKESTPEVKLEEKLESNAEEKSEHKAEEKPEPKVEVKEEPTEDDGLGLGLGGGKKRPRKKKTTAAPETVASRAGSAQQEKAAPSSQSQEPTAMPIQQSLAEPLTQQGPPVGYPQPGPPAGYPLPLGGLAQQLTGPPRFAPPPQAQSSAAWGGGRGRGRGQDPALQAGLSAPKLQPRAPSSMPPTQPLTQQQPTPTPVSASSSREMVKMAPSRQEINCRFKIPIKILGRNVPHTPTRVITNYLPMEFKPLKVYRYDVTVKPDKPKKVLPQVFKVAKEKTYPRELLAFDQVKNCYSLTALKDVPLDGSARKAIPVDIKDQNGKVMQFEVTFKATGIVDFAKIKQHMENGGSSLNTPSEEIQCIDVVLRQGALEAYVKCGRQFFKRPNKPIQLSGGLEMWTGLFQSAIFTSKAFINVDVAHKGFPIQQSLIQAVTGSFRLRTDRPIDEQWGRDSEYFQLFIKNLRVVATLVGPPNNGQKRDFICNGLVAPPGKLNFTCDRDGTKTVMSVAEYFAKEKGYKIKFPNLNCVWVGPRDRFIYYPMELLDVAYGQALNKQLNEMQLSIMVKEAATPPVERKRKIEEVAASMNYSSNVFFKKFGLEISNQFLQVDAKILTPPCLDVGDRNPITPSRGSWQTNKLVKPEALQSWGFIAIDCDPTASNYENIRSLLMGSGRQMGMAVAEPKLKYFNVKITELRNILFAALDKEVRFLFIIVSARGRDTYHKVKQFAERDVGILTQCIKENTASRRMNPQTMKNILLKVNSKLMGINQVLDSRYTPNCLKNGDVMIVGADVTHPSPEQTSIPSIAAVTASMDAKCFSYNIELSIQTPKKEMIVEFGDMMYDHLTLYRQRNRALPKKIYVFRDGVSDGQFAQVMNSELSAVHKAYQRFNVPYKPEVLFLLVQKRHHTRFFTVPHCANVEPGTVVDTHIVHPKELDFYLVSHQAIKGTARPTRYHAVCNDGNIPHDEVEQLTYYLCHLYSRCMRSVSYPTPTYYAHLACLRARSLTHGQTFDNNALDTKPQRLRVLDKMLQFSRMFFV